MWSDDDFQRVLDGVSRLGWLVLRRFSATYRPSDILAAFACLPRGEFDLLRRLHFALSEELSEFLIEHVTTFVRTTPTTTEHVLEDRRGMPRGRVDWLRTYAKRTQSAGDPTRFVTRPIERSNDSPAGRLFAYLLSMVSENADWLTKRRVPDFALGRILEGGGEARRNLAILRARGVRTPTHLHGREIAPLRKSRRPDVIAAIRLFDMYVHLVELANENLLRALLRQRQLAPENLDDLFEVWTLLTFVELHLNEGWELTDAYLIGGATGPKRPRFTLAKGDLRAELFFQTVPSEMGKTSEYKEIFEDYDLDVTMRRPDITAKISGPEGVQYLIVEVKRTRDQGYILDGVYKTLGYVADFRTTIGPNAPFALLIVWEGLNRKTSGFTDSPIHIATATEFESMSLPY